MKVFESGVVFENCPKPTVNGVDFQLLTVYHSEEDYSNRFFLLPMNQEEVVKKRLFSKHFPVSLMLGQTKKTVDSGFLKAGVTINLIDVTQTKDTQKSGLTGDMDYLGDTISLWFLHVEIGGEELIISTREIQERVFERRGPNPNVCSLEVDFDLHVVHKGRIYPIRIKGKIAWALGIVNVTGHYLGTDKAHVVLKGYNLLGYRVVQKKR